MKELINTLVNNEQIKKHLIDMGAITELDTRGVSIEIKVTQDKEIITKMEGNPLALLVILNDTIEDVKKDIGMSDEEYEMLLNCVLYNSRKVDE